MYEAENEVVNHSTKIKVRTGNSDTAVLHSSASSFTSTHCERSSTSLWLANRRWDAER